MRYAVIMAGGSGTRLWPMSRRGNPKQLIPFLDGRSLLQMAWERLDGLLEPERIYVCAAEEHRRAIAEVLPDLRPACYIGEPVGRDTLNAAGLSAGVIHRRDPDAIIATVTADHIIGPTERFQAYVAMGFELVERDQGGLVTFGVTPTAPATGFGYLEIGPRLEAGVHQVLRFCEKPELPQAQVYFDAGPERYLWNSGMFVWRADTLLDCIEHYEPDTFDGLRRITAAWEGPDARTVLAKTYPDLRKISVDYAVMERVSQEPGGRVLAVPMTLEWMDVGNWRNFALTCPSDDAGNRIGADRAILQGCRNTLAASSDPNHLVAVVGCEGLMVIHTPDATLICPADRVEDVKPLTEAIAERFGPEAL